MKDRKGQEVSEGGCYWLDVDENKTNVCSCY